MGCLNIGVGLAMLASPYRIARALGMGERRKLVRLLGVRDLIIGMGILGQGSPSPWVWVRATSDVADAAMMAAGAFSGTFVRKRSMPGMFLALGFAGLSCILARRLD